MSLIGQISIAMTTNTAPFAKGLGTAQTMLANFEVKALHAGTAVKALFAGAALGGAGAALHKLIQAGSDATENLNKLDATFGKSAASVNAFNTSTATAFGTSIREMQDAEGTLGGIFKGLGYASDDAAKLSVEMVKLANDVASFKNLSFAQSLEKIRAGLTGESEPLKAIGVVMTEAIVKTEAYKMGIAKLGDELTEQQKVQARLSVLTKSLADAQGDYAKTAGEVANSTRGMWGQIDNLAATIGEKLQPVAKTVLGEINTSLSVLSGLWKDTGMNAVSSSAATVQSMGFVQATVGKVADTVQYLGQIWIGTQANATAFAASTVEFLSGYENQLNKVTLAVRALMGDLGAAAEMMKSVTTGGDATGKTTFGFKEMGKELKALAKQQEEAFKKSFEKPLPSTAINKLFDDAKKRVADLRKELATSGFDVNKFTPKSDAMPGKTATAKKSTISETKFASAAEFGSEDAANTILRSKFGGGRSGKELERLAASGEKSEAYLKKIADWTGKSSTPGHEIWSNF